MKNPTCYEAMREFIPRIYASPAFTPVIAYQLIDKVIFNNHAEGKISRTEREELESLNEKYYRNYTGSTEYPA